MKDAFYNWRPKIDEDEDDDIQVYQRPWVDLTIEEIAACCMESTTTQLQFARAVLAKSKEKNNG